MVALADDLARAAAAASAHAVAGEAVVGVLASETAGGARVYLCAFAAGEDGPRSWLALDDAGLPFADRQLVADAVSMAALCEVAAEAAFPGDLDELRAQLVQVRLTEAPPGIEEAEAAAAELQRTVGAPPQLASPERLDAIGASARRLEAALSDPGGGSPFTAAMQGAQVAVEGLRREVEAGYRLPLR
jgi:hypothetical protein